MDYNDGSITENTRVTSRQRYGGVGKNLGMSKDGYGSLPINSNFRGINIHVPAILMFNRVQGFDPSKDGDDEVEVYHSLPSEMLISVEDMFRTANRLSTLLSYECTCD